MDQEIHDIISSGKTPIDPRKSLLIKCTFSLVRPNCTDKHLLSSFATSERDLFKMPMLSIEFFLQSASPQDCCDHLNALALQQLPVDSLSAWELHASSLLQHLIKCQCIQVVTKNIVHQKTSPLSRKLCYLATEKYRKEFKKASIKSSCCPPVPQLTYFFKCQILPVIKNEFFLNCFPSCEIEKNSEFIRT